MWTSDIFLQGSKNIENAMPDVVIDEEEAGEDSNLKLRE